MHRTADLGLPLDPAWSDLLLIIFSIHLSARFTSCHWSSHYKHFITDIEAFLIEPDFQRFTGLWLVGHWTLNLMFSGLWLSGPQDTSLSATPPGQTQNWDVCYWEPCWTVRHSCCVFHKQQIRPVHPKFQKKYMELIVLHNNLMDGLALLEFQYFGQTSKWCTVETT